MKLKVGMKVKVKQFVPRPSEWNSAGAMDYLMGQVVTIRSLNGDRVRIKEDPTWAFEYQDFEPINDWDE